MATNDVTIRLNAQDKASPSINQVKQSLTGLVSAQGVMGGVVGGLIGGGMMGLANAAISAAAAIPQAVGELANLAMQAERTETAFVALSSGVGQSSQAMLAAMKAMTAGTVADTDLMLAANRAMMLGVSDNADEMGKLMAAAIERGRALGVSSQQAVNDIITGIGRMSPMILDNLGIVGVTQSVEEYARSLGKTADALTDVEKKQALVNAVIASGSGGPVLDDAASSFERMDASIANMKVALGELFSPAIAAIAQQLADAVTGVTESFDASALQASQSELFQLGNTLTELMTAYDAAITSMQDAAIAANGPGMKEAAAQAEMLMMSIEAVAASYNEAAAITGAPLIDVDAIRRGEIAFVDAANAANNLGAAAASSAGGMSIAESQAASLAARLQALAGQADNAGVSLRNAFLNAASALGATGALSGFQAKQKELQALRQEWQYMGLTSEQIAFREQEFLGKTNDAIRSQITAMDDLGASAGRAASGGVSQLDSAFESLRGRVQSMLSGALSPEGISIPGLPRTDDINENARRLAAIANEGIGDQSWMEEFKAEVPGIFDEIVNAANPQAAAARIFQEFQLGLRPELMDKELIKQRIKDAILGEQKMDALATEIATELSASMGISLPAALKAAQEALGVAPTGADTDKFGEGFEEGIDAQATAAGSIAKIAKAFLDNQSSVKSSGAVVGAWWGEGFMAVVGDNVPPGLLDMMTVKLLPYIMAAMANASGARPDDE